MEQVTYRYKRIQFDGQTLSEFFRDGGKLKISGTVHGGLPSDAKVVRVFDDHYEAGVFSVVFESAEFEPVEHGVIIPTLDIYITRDEA